MPKAADNSVKAVGSSYLLGTGWHSQLTHLDFAPESPEWFAWLAEIPSFRFECKYGKYTARKEPREQVTSFMLFCFLWYHEGRERSFRDGRSLHCGGDGYALAKA